MKRLLFCFLLAILLPTVSLASSCTSLSLGASGPGVTALQTFFVNAYSNFPQADVTGYFGPITQAAVEEWQSDHGIVSSGTPATTGYGVVGPRTAAAMGLTLCSASQGSATASATAPASNATLLQTLYAELHALEAEIAALTGGVATSSTTTTGGTPSGGGGSGGGSGGGGTPPPIPAPPPLSAPTITYVSNSGSSVTGSYANLSANSQIVVINQTSGQPVSGISSTVTGSGTVTLSGIPAGTFYLEAKDSSSNYLAQSVSFTSTGSANSSCTLNGTTIADGSSGTFYSDAAVAYGDSCTNYAQTRTCTNGVLSGSSAYQYSACAVGNPNACSFNGQAVASGASVTAYQSGSVPFGQTCSSQSRMCSNGNLSGSYQYPSCTVQAAASCTFNGQTVPNGQSVTAYQTSTVPSGQQCVSQSRMCSNGALSGTYQYVSCSVLQPQPPLIGAFRWDGWFPTNSSVFPQYFPSNFYTAWSYRQPTYGWFDADTSGAQAIMDQEILDAANHGLDFWVFDDYKFTETWPQDGSQRPLYDAYKEYLASPNKSHIKFALWISPGVTSGGGVVQNYWRGTYLPYLIQTFQDPQYLKVNGNRPVLFVSGSGSSPSDIDQNFTNWPQEHAYLNQQAEAAGLGDPVIIQTDADTATAQADALDGVTTYGVMGNGATPTSGCAAQPGNPTPSCPFSSQMAKDESNWTAAAQSGLTAVVPGLTPVDDSRALTSPYGFYVDQPIYTQWQQELKDAFTFMTNNRSKETNPPIAVIYAWNELSEGGPGIMPTNQNGTMFLDAIEAVKSGNYPSTYTDTLNGDSDLIVRSGNWNDYTPVSGNFNNDEEISESSGDTATLSADNATAFKIVGTEGPTDGVMLVYIDGVSQGAVARTAANWTQDAVVFQSAALPAGTHTLKIANISSGSNVYVGIDYIVVSHGAVNAPATPTVSFTANGQGSLTVNVGDSVTYQWNVTNAVSASGTYTVDGGAPQPWTGGPNGLSGSQTAIIAASQAGHTYVVTYTGTNAQGQSAFANILVKVNP